MLSGVEYIPGNRVVQLYVTYFVYVRIYLFPHRKYAHKCLSCFFVDYGVTDHLKFYNALDMTKRSNWENILDTNRGIKILKTETHSYFHNNAESEVQPSQRISLC